MTLATSGLQLDPVRYGDLPEVEITADADWRDGLMKAQSEVRGLGRDPLAVSLQVPADLSVRPFRLSVPPSGPLSGRVRGVTDLALLAPLLVSDGDVLQGRVAVDVAVGGTATAPDLSGTAVMENGRYENAATGFLLDGIQLRAVGDRDALVVESLSAGDGNGGRVSGRGRVSISTGDRFPYQAQLDLAGAKVLRRDEAEATVTGAVRLSGDAAHAKIESRLTVDGGELRIPEKLPAQVSTLEVSEINTPPELAALRLASRRKPASAVELDSVVEIPGRFFVRGRGLDSEWKGRITTMGSLDQLKVAGGLQLVRGRFDLLGKDFALKKGAIDFSRGLEADPEIDILAELTTADIVGRAALVGPISAPEVRLTSEPPLPSDEILARILFDKRAGQLTALEALQLADAAATLAGKGGGDFMGQIRRSLGLDQLRVSSGAGEAGGATVSAGKYVADGVFVSVDGAAQPENSKVRVEVEVTPNVSVETDVGADAQGNLGVIWTWDY
jgi:translocation and assembly module TamB